jgi:acyl-lipid omega-6 desaturase (Delta-12 desaturase)
MTTLAQVRARTAPFRTPSTKRAIFEIAVTLTSLTLLILLGTFSLLWSTWLGVLIGVLTGPLFVRTFVLAHDASHGTLFPRAWQNRWAGRALATIALTPFGAWRTTHVYHHAHAGNLSVHRSRGAMPIMTTHEYDCAPRLHRLGYRLMYHPIILLGILPPLLYHCFYRLPMGTRSEVRSIIATNGALILLGVCLWYALGGPALYLVILPATLTGSMIGVWLFFVQHCHKEAKYAEGEGVDPLTLHLGASHYELPRWLNVLTLWIGHHTLHHIDPQIPSYHLELAWLVASPLLPTVPRMTIRESMKTTTATLWDKEKGTLVSIP